jgi:hypothetical protein
LALKMLERVRPSISAQAVNSEPITLGLWLANWLTVGGDLSYPAVSRVVQRLWYMQQENGCWLSGPIKRVARTIPLRAWARSDSGRLYVDDQCLVATVTVFDGLRLLAEKLEQEDKLVRDFGSG